MRMTRLAGLNVRIAGGADREGGGTGPVVVLLHGYGAPGTDLVPLARVLAVPREVRFVFPEASLAPAELAPYGGRAWWQIDIQALQQAMAEGRARERMNSVPEGLAAAREQLVALLDAIQTELNVSSDRILLGGFSQGSMLALDVALRDVRPLAGLVLLSTTPVSMHEWQPLMAARKGLCVLQTHGTHDTLLPHALAEEERDLLRAAGLDVTWISFMGGHELPPNALDALSRFICQRFEL